MASKRRGRRHRVTDHAVLRWLERVEGIDVEAVRSRILSEDLRKVLLRCPTGRFPLGNGYSVVCREGCVISVAESRPGRHYRTPSRREA